MGRAGRHNPGDDVLWVRPHRGKYGLPGSTESVPARVVRVTPERVTIEALGPGGTARRVSVKPTSLRPRDALSPAPATSGVGEQPGPAMLRSRFRVGPR